MSDAFRKRMGRRVREVWVRWAEKQPNPKPSWLLNYDAITPAEQDADDCIGMAIWAECFDKFQSEIAELELTKQRLAAAEAEIVNAREAARLVFHKATFIGTAKEHNRFPGWQKIAEMYTWLAQQEDDTAAKGGRDE